MATGVGMGFDLSKLESEFKKLDEQLSKLMKKGETFKDEWNKIFTSMGKEGLSSFASQLAKMRKDVVGFGKVKVGIKWDSVGLQKYIDDVNRLIYVIKNVQQETKKEGIKGPSIQGLKKEVKDAQELLKIVKKTEDTSSVSMRNLAAQYEAEEKYNKRRQDNQKSQMEALRKFAEERAKLEQQATDRNKANEHKRLQAEWQAELKARDEAEKAAIKAEEERYKQQEKQRVANAVATSNNLDKLKEQQHRKELQEIKEEEAAANRKHQNEIDRINKRFDLIRRREENQRRETQAKLNTTQGALGAYNQLYSPQGVRSLNQMKTVLKQLETAQANINRATKEGQRDWKQVGDAIKRVKGDIERTEKEMGKFHNSQKGVLDTSGQLARALAAVFSVSAIKGYVNKLMQIRGEFEMQQRSLQVLLQNKDEANALWDKTVALAVKSPFTTKQLVTYTKQLAAYRVESEKLYETNKMLADVSAGLGVDMNRLILAFGQVKAANFLRGTELRQFSEAGVNMLDELAKRFTMLEGRAVSVGEVFERVSKRMVSFKDVEAVFKTITSEGGVFYQMQEKQSETLKGMMLNLKDSYELMLNDIGKGNEGMLKGFVSMMKSLVDNWQEIAFMLEKIGYSLLTYTAVTKLAQFGSSKLATSLFTLGAGANFGGKAVTFLSNALKGLGAGLIIGAISAVAYALMELWRSTTKASREAEKLQKELNSIYNEDYTNFKQQTKNFEDLVGRLYSVNQGSEEHREIIQKLNSQYGEYLGYIVTETTSYDKLYLSINKVNDAIIRKAKSATYEKAFSRAFEDTNQRISRYQEDLKNRIENATVSKIGKNGMLYSIIPTEEELNDIFALFEKKVKESGENISQWVELQEIFKEYGFELGTPVFWSSSELVNYSKTVLEQKEAELKLEQQINAQYGDTTAKTVEHRNALKQIDEIEKNRLEKAKKQGDTSSIAYQKEVDRIKKEAQISRIQAQVQYEGLDKDVANKRIAELNKFSDTVIDINNKIEASADKLGEKYASIIYIDEAEAETGISQIAESAAQSYKTMRDVIKQQNALKEAGTVHDQDILENAEKTAAAYYYKLQLLGRLDLLQKEENKKETEALKLLNKQLSALKESKQTFDQLRQKFGLEEATQKTAKAFEDLFKELDMTAFTIDMTFDNQGIIDVINELPNKAGEAGKQAMEKLKAEMAGGVAVGVKVREDEDLLRQIENMFSGYELSIELQKLNIPPDLAKRLFNVDSISLPELKNQLVGMEDLFVGTEMEKQYRDFLQKVVDMEKKSQEEMLKNYSKYLVQAQSERVKILLEEQRMLDKIASLSIGDEDKALMRKGVEKEIQKRLQQQAWKDFQDSGMYLRLFENLEGASMQSLDTMEAKLKRLRDSFTELDPSKLKEINNQLEKIQELKVEKNPFKDLKEDATTFFEYLKNKKDWEKNLADSEAKEKSLQTLIDYEQLGISDLEKKVAAKEKEKGADDKEVRLLSAELTFRKRSLKILLDQLEAQKLKTKEQRKNLEDGENAKASLEDRFSKAAEYATGIANSLGSMTESLERVFGMSTGLKETLQIIQGVGMGLGDMLGGAAGIMSGDPLKMIQGGMQAISGFANIIGSFNKAHDERREKSIQRELKLVENLTRLYEELGKKIEMAYSVDTFQAANKQAQQNLDAQIQARERMIQSEKDKKETDWERINEWNNEIEELLEEAKRLEQERLSNLGGVGGEAGYKDAAQGFMDAWLDAFMETGHGLDALEDEFDTFLKNIVAKQLMLKATDSFLAPLFKTIDEAVYDADVTRDEMQKIREEAEKTLPNLDEFLKQLAADLGMSDMAGVKGELGGLQAGIQGITAEQSDILASYLNSIRFFVADSNTQLKALVAAQGIDTDAPNPMLSQLINIAESVRQNAATTDAINDLLNRVKLSTNDGTALKVRMV